MNFKECLKEFLKNSAMKRQKAFDKYLKLQQQRKQMILKYLRKLKNQLSKLDNDAQKFKTLFMKF